MKYLFLLSVTLQLFYFIFIFTTILLEFYLSISCIFNFRYNIITTFSVLFDLYHLDSLSCIIFTGYCPSRRLRYRPSLADVCSSKIGSKLAWMDQIRKTTQMNDNLSFKTINYYIWHFFFWISIFGFRFFP